MTVGAKKTEFICMGCWGTFTPKPEAEGDVICPHCGARQEVQHEPIDLDPDEFVDLGPELAGGVAAAASVAAAESPRGAVGPSAVDDDDFDAVIEIDLDEIDANEPDAEPSRLTEPLPEPQAEAIPEAGPPADAEAGGGPAVVAQSLFLLRTERGHVYTFLSPEALILWARRLKQAQKALQVSLDGVDWQPFLPFLTRLAATGQIAPEVQQDVDGALSAEAEVSDASLAASLEAERHEFEVNAPLPSPDVPPVPGSSGRSDGRKGEPPPPADAGPARGVGDFTFKVEELRERAVVRYAVMLSLGLVAGAGVAAALAFLGLLPRPPF